MRTNDGLEKDIEAIFRPFIDTSIRGHKIFWRYSRVKAGPYRFKRIISIILKRTLSSY